MKHQCLNNGKLMTQKENIFQLAEKGDKDLISLLDAEIKEFSNIVDSKSENKIKSTFSQIKKIISALYIKKSARLHNSTFYDFNEYDLSFFPIKINSTQKEAILFKRFIKYNLLNLHYLDSINNPNSQKLNKLITPSHVTYLCGAFAAYLDQIHLLNHDFLSKEELEQLAKKDDLEALLILGKNDKSEVTFLNYKTESLLTKKTTIIKKHLVRASSLGYYRASWVLLENLFEEEIKQSKKNEPTKSNLDIYKRHIQNLENYFTANPNKYFVNFQLALYYLAEEITIYDTHPESEHYNFVRYAKKLNQYSPSKGLKYLLKAIELLDSNPPTPSFSTIISCNLIAIHYYFKNNNKEWEKHIQNCYTAITKISESPDLAPISNYKEITSIAHSLELLKETANKLDAPNKQKKLVDDFDDFLESLENKPTLISELIRVDYLTKNLGGFYITSNNHLNEVTTIHEILKNNISLPDDIDKLDKIIATSGAKELNPFSLLARATRAHLEKTNSDDINEINDTISKAEKEGWYVLAFNQYWRGRIKDLNLSMGKTTPHKITLTTEILNNFKKNNYPLDWTIIDDFQTYKIINETNKSKNKAAEFLTKRIGVIYEESVQNRPSTSEHTEDTISKIFLLVKSEGEFDPDLSSIIETYLIELLHISISSHNYKNNKEYLLKLRSDNDINKLLFKNMENIFLPNSKTSKIHQIKPNEFLKKCYSIWDKIYSSDEKLSEYEKRDNFLFEFLKESHPLENIKELKELKELRSELYDLISSTNLEKYNLFTSAEYTFDISKPLATIYDERHLSRQAIPKLNESVRFLILIQKAHNILTKFSDYGSTEDSFILSKLNLTIKKWRKLNKEQLDLWVKLFTENKGTEPKLISNALEVPLIREQFEITLQSLDVLAEELQENKNTFKIKSLKRPLESPHALLNKLKPKKTTEKKQQEIHARLHELSESVEPYEETKKLFQNVFLEAKNFNLNHKNYELEKTKRKLEQSEISIKNMIQQSTHVFSNTIFPERLSNIAQTIYEDNKFHEESLLLMDSYQAELTLKLQNDLISKKIAFQQEPQKLRNIVRRYTIHHDHEKCQTIHRLLDFCFTRVLSRILNDNTFVNSIISQAAQPTNKKEQSFLLDFQNKVIFSKVNQLSSYTWCNSNFRPVKLRINNSIWDSVGVEKNQSAEAFFYGHFSEIISNAFKYADHSQKHFLEITFDETHINGKKFLSITFTNPFKKDFSLQSTKQGLKSIRGDLHQLNDNKNKELDEIFNSEETDFLPVSTENGKFSVTYLIKHEFLIAKRHTLSKNIKF